MRGACSHVLRMTMIQIRNVPEDVHRKLKAKAALAGLSLSDFLLQELVATSDRLSIEEFRARVQGRPLDLPISPTEVLRAEREQN
jgi:plasmid stability protein